jgi:hypothetical protein
MQPDFSDLIPVPPQALIDEIVQTHQVSQEFYREVQYRQEFEQYCQWYYEAAAAHRRELEQMKGDLNILKWFWRK